LILKYKVNIGKGVYIELSKKHEQIPDTR